MKRSTYLSHTLVSVKYIQKRLLVMKKKAISDNVEGLEMLQVRDSRYLEDLSLDKILQYVGCSTLKSY